MKKIEFTVRIEPRPMPRPRFTRGRTYTPKDIRIYQAACRQAAAVAMHGREPLQGDLACTLKFYRKFKASSRRFGDGDNLYKAATDALQGVCFCDDSQIVIATIEKHTDKISPRIEFSIELLN